MVIQVRKGTRKGWVSVQALGYRQARVPEEEPVNPETGKSEGETAEEC